MTLGDRAVVKEHLVRAVGAGARCRPLGSDAEPDIDPVAPKRGEPGRRVPGVIVGH